MVSSEAYSLPGGVLDPKIQELFGFSNLSFYSEILGSKIQLHGIKLRCASGQQWVLLRFAASHVGRAAAPSGRNFRFNTSNPSATRKPTHLPVNPHPTITMSAAWKTAGLSYASLRCNWAPGHRN